MLLVLGGAASANLGGLLSNRFSVPGSDPERGLDLLKTRMNERSDGARTLINWFRPGTRVPGVLRPVEVNGGPGALYLDEQQRLIDVVALDIAGGQIRSISSILNPDKLMHLGQSATSDHY